MTHAQKLLELLSDGRPHSHHETYRLGIMAHSRAADLRKQGHDVRVWREDGSYWYQLALSEGDALLGGNPPPSESATLQTPNPWSSSSPEDSVLGASADASEDVSSPPSPGHEGACRSAPSGQLTMLEPDEDEPRHMYARDAA